MQGSCNQSNTVITNKRSSLFPGDK